MHRSIRWGAALLSVTVLILPFTTVGDGAAEQFLNRTDSSCHSAHSQGSILSYALARKEHPLRPPRFIIVDHLV